MLELFIGRCGDIMEESLFIKTIDASGIISGVKTVDSTNIVTGTITTPTKPINSVFISGKKYQIEDAVARLQIDEIIEKIEKMLKAPKMKSISCMHCGAPLEMKFDDHIVKCSYCHSAYAIDTDMIRDIRDE